ncbi:hypothetical protein Tco_0490514 [Tanacetum coccineum]
MIDSYLENIDHKQIIIPPPASPEQLLNDFMDPPDFLEIDDLESNVEFMDTPVVSPFLDSDGESDDGEVVNDIYVNTKYCDADRRINKFYMRDLAFPCIIGFRQLNVHVYIGSFTYDGFYDFYGYRKYIESELSEVVIGIPFKDLAQLEDDCNKGLISFKRIWDTYIFQMPRTVILDEESVRALRISTWMIL